MRCVGYERYFTDAGRHTLKAASAGTQQLISLIEQCDMLSTIDLRIVVQ